MVNSFDSLYETPVCSIFSKILPLCTCIWMTQLPTMMNTNIWCNHYLMSHVSLADIWKMSTDIIRHCVWLVFLVLWQHYYYVIFRNMLTYQQRKNLFTKNVLWKYEWIFHLIFMHYLTFLFKLDIKIYPSKESLF